MGKLRVGVMRCLLLGVVMWLPLLGLVLAFAVPCARAVPLPTGDTALSGTTSAQRPELAGVVIEDQLIPYSFQGAGYSVSGVIQNRVVRTVDGTLEFSWRIRPDASSTGDITAFRVGGFDGFALDGDFCLDCLGSVGPAIARNFGDGNVDFLFSNGVSGTEESYFFFLYTQATTYSNTGGYYQLCVDNDCISPLFTTFAPTSQPEPGLLAPGWYSNSGPGIIYEDLELRVVWQNSYIYPYPGDSALYWYAQVIYLNRGSQSLPIDCVGRTDPAFVKEHMRGTPNSGTVGAEETFCTRNPDFTGAIEPGGAHYEWAIFHNVPLPGGEVSLEWGPSGLSQWVDPWYSPFDAPPPAECPPELVRLGTCQPAVVLADTNFPVQTQEFQGQVNLPPGFGLQPTSLHVETFFGGTSSLAADGTFVTRMNTQAVGLLMLEDTSGTPVMLAVFPKHELLSNQNPSITSQTTAIALVFMQPGVTVTDPIVAAILMRVIETLPETQALTQLLEQKMAIDPTVLAKGDPEILAAVANVIEALLNRAEAVSGSSEAFTRQGSSIHHNDTRSENFYDIDDKDGDRVDTTAVIDPTTLHGDFTLVNHRSRWVFFHVDTVGATSFPPFENLVDAVIPSKLRLPSIKDLIFDILVSPSNFDLIRSLFGPEELGDALLDRARELVANYYGPSESEFSFDFAGDSTLSSYAPGRSTVIATHSRDIPPFIGTLLTEVLFPSISVIMDVSIHDTMFGSKHGVRATVNLVEFLTINYGTEFGNIFSPGVIDPNVTFPEVEDAFHSFMRLLVKILADEKFQEIIKNALGLDFFKGLQKLTGAFLNKINPIDQTIAVVNFALAGIKFTQILLFEDNADAYQITFGVHQPPVQEVSLIGVVPDIFTTSGGLFTVSVAPRDAEGNLITGGVTAANFAFRDISVALAATPNMPVTAGTADVTEVAILETREPVTLVLDFDSSGSMSDNDPDRRRVDAGKQVVALLTAADQAAIMDFGAGVDPGLRASRLLQDFTADPPLLGAAIDRVTAGGGTPLFDSALDALELLAATSSLRPAVIILTDGEDNRSGSTPADVITQAQAQATPLFTIGLGSDVGVTPLQDIARETGGTFAAVTDAAALTVVLEQIGLSIVEGRVVVTGAGRFEPPVASPGTYVVSGVLVTTLGGTAIETPFSFTVDVVAEGVAMLAAARTFQRPAVPYTAAQERQRATELGTLRASGQ